MLQLEHINLVVNDIPETLRFYQAAFPHWRVREQGANDPHRRNVYFMDPSGIEVEFVQYCSDLPSQRNLSS
jgi:catechol 2,3-dioxygenase-like lactoylglutathione lyase family enzyme